jgi:carbonic anhydrase
MKDMPRALFEGYIAFKYGRFRTERARYRELADTGQKPELMVIGCCDSRAAPEVIFDAVPGQVFTVRNVANLVPPYDPDGEFHGTSAALEYAVQALHVKHILVLGHARCGGIAASLARDTNPLTRDDFIGKWISMVDAARGDLEAMDPPAENRIEAAGEAVDHPLAGQSQKLPVHPVPGTGRRSSSARGLFRHRIGRAVLVRQGEPGLQDGRIRHELADEIRGLRGPLTSADAVISRSA